MCVKKFIKSMGVKKRSSKSINTIKDKEKNEIWKIKKIWVYKKKQEKGKKIKQ